MQLMELGDGIIGITDTDGTFPSFGRSVVHRVEPSDTPKTLIRLESVSRGAASADQPSAGRAAL